MHAKFLLRNGADDVICPERQMANWSAVRYTADHVFDYMELTDDHSVFETAAPASWVGKPIAELAVRQKHRIHVLATKCNGNLAPLSGPTHCFRDLQRFLHL